MKIGEFEITSPLIFGEQENEAEVFGAAVWLWVHSPMHRDAPLHLLPTLLLPVIKSQQYVLVSRHEKPIFFLSWAWMDEAAERRYLTRSPTLFPVEDWNSGDRMWFSDWVAPFGDTREMYNLVRRHIFPHACVRALYHHGATRGLRVLKFKGSQVTAENAREWWQSHPLAKI